MIELTTSELQLGDTVYRVRRDSETWIELSSPRIIVGDDGNYLLGESLNSQYTDRLVRMDEYYFWLVHRVGRVTCLCKCGKQIPVVFAEFTHEC